MSDNLFFSKVCTMSEILVQLQNVIFQISLSIFLSICLNSMLLRFGSWIIKLRHPMITMPKSKPMSFRLHVLCFFLLSQTDSCYFFLLETEKKKAFISLWGFLTGQGVQGVTKCIGNRTNIYLYKQNHLFFNYNIYFNQICRSLRNCDTLYIRNCDTLYIPHKSFLPYQKTLLKRIFSFKLDSFFFIQFNKLRKMKILQYLQSA